MCQENSGPWSKKFETAGLDRWEKTEERREPLAAYCCYSDEDCTHTGRELKDASYKTDPAETSWCGQFVFQVQLELGGR